MNYITPETAMKLADKFALPRSLGQPYWPVIFNDVIKHYIESSVSELTGTAYTVLAEYPLPDSLYQGSKDWTQGSYRERVQWLHEMYENQKEQTDIYVQMAQPAKPLKVEFTKEWCMHAAAAELEADWDITVGTQPAKPVELTPCRCFDEVSKRLCLNKNRCVRIEAAKERT
jgi:hypothetical protein